MISSEYGWTDEQILAIRPIERLHEIVEAISWRKRQEDYREWQRAALIATTIINAFGRKRKKVEDLIGKPPKREEQRPRYTMNELFEAARAKGVKVPNGC